MSSLVIMVHDGKKWYHFRFKGICGYNVNNRGKYLISLAAVFFVGEERLNV